MVFIIAATEFPQNFKKNYILAAFDVRLLL